jgi:hypothetical protein
MGERASHPPVRPLPVRSLQSRAHASVDPSMRRAVPGRFLGVPTVDTLNTPWEALRRARSSGCRREACAPQSHRRPPQRGAFALSTSPRTSGRHAPICIHPFPSAKRLFVGPRWFRGCDSSSIKWGFSPRRFWTKLSTDGLFQAVNTNGSLRIPSPLDGVDRV